MVTEANKANIIFAMYFIILLETYDESGRSGTSLSRTPALIQLMQSVPKGRIDQNGENRFIHNKLSLQFPGHALRFGASDRSNYSLRSVLANNPLSSWKRVLAFSIGIPPECLSENPRKVSLSLRLTYHDTEGIRIFPLLTTFIINPRTHTHHQGVSFRHRTNSSLY